MALKFGTSGVRGLVTEMSDRECYLYTLAFLDFLRRQKCPNKIAIAGDRRSSTPRIMNAVAYALTRENVEVINCGTTPTPALINYCIQHKIGGIMVTGSHIPDDRNGIKFNVPKGEILKDDESEITTSYKKFKAADKDFTSDSEYPFDDNGYLKQDKNGILADVSEEAQTLYIKRYLDFFPKNCLAGVSVVVYQHSAVGRDILVEILSQLGAHIISVGRSENFIPVDAEAVDNVENLRQWLKDNQADVLVSMDGDSDRPLVMDETGKLVPGDILGLITAKFFKADSVVAPVSCNTALERCGKFPNITRTKIGSPHVIASMMSAVAWAHKRILGYEANGGLLTASSLVMQRGTARLSALPTRDAILPILSVLICAKQKNKSISGIVDELPNRFTDSGLLREFSSERGKHLILRLRQDEEELANHYFSSDFGNVKSIDFTDGTRMTFENGDIIHLRPSGNAPEFRCYTESDSIECAVSNNARALEIIANAKDDDFHNNVNENFGDDYTNKEKQIFANIESINSTILQGTGMDIVIISTTSSFQEDYWQQRLEVTRGQIANDDALIIAVHEDWIGGAGNGLGTLYAVKKAIVKAKEKFNIDLMSKIKDGASVGLYHTAGKGTRLAPLPGSENNNKPGVKLPGMVFLANEPTPITILESVIKQTSLYASSRKGRISVFWGDQIFIPDIKVNYTPTHHADILCCLGAMPDKDEWIQRGLDKYGLITVNGQNNAAQVEKISYETATELIRNKVIGVEKGIGVSLGSFSISREITEQLLTEFKEELEQKSTKLDADPHFWMPMTLDEETYLSIMSAKGENREQISTHYNRMTQFKKELQEKSSSLNVFGAVDIGDGSYWWDYGQIKYYIKNCIKMIDQDHESEAMRRFFNLHKRIDHSQLSDQVNVDDNSFIWGSKITKGSIKNSLLIGVHAGELDVENCVMIKITAANIIANQSLLYNVAEDKQLDLKSNSVRADSFVPFSSHYSLLTTTDRDGGKDWSIKLENNDLSFEELFDTNKDVDIVQAEMFTKMEHQRVSCAVFQTIW